ncbi:MAG: DNA polymerase III subunit delta [Candidatus Omnitrophica bacterium]|nr:DNA polymerase III subunit delta [Candidatus Omnitrophota bacterium]
MPTNFPVYIFKGNEKYLKKEAVEKFKKALLGKGSEAFNFNIYDIGKCDLKDVLDTLRSAPFISGKRLIVLRDAGSASPKEKNLIVEYAKNPSRNSCLIIDVSKEELERDFYGDIRRYAREESFTSPKGGRMVLWIQNEIKKRGKTIRNDAAILLGEIKQEDTDGLINEIEKLISYAGKRPMVTKEDVEAITGGSASRSIFELVDALSRKDAKEALIVSSELLKAKKSVSEILGMVGWQLRRIKKAKGLVKKGASHKTVSEECNISSYQADRFLKEIRSFTQKDIDRNLEYLLEADYGIKTGHMKPQDALESLMIRICAVK